MRRRHQELVEAVVLPITHAERFQVQRAAAAAGRPSSGAQTGHRHHAAERRLVVRSTRHRKNIGVFVIHLFMHVCECIFDSLSVGACLRRRNKVLVGCVPFIRSSHIHRSSSDLIVFLDSFLKLAAPQLVQMFIGDGFNHRETQRAVTA